VAADAAVAAEGGGSAMFMKSRQQRLLLFLVAAAFLCTSGLAATTAATTAATHRTFASAQAAADALVGAAAQYDVPALMEILGPDGHDLVVSEDPVLDKNLAAEFAKMAKEKMTVIPDKANPKKATVVVGPDDWPLPIPVVEKEGKWSFDTAAGKREILMRRIGRNELDAIEVCRGYVEAQNEYASVPRGGSEVPQYAQRVIGNAEKQDGLAWHDKDGTWRGPIGEKIAGAIAEGYSTRGAPYHGYYFKVLKGQGPAAPLGQLDYVVNGVMIGGFALAAAPADYRVTGVMTFIVSNDGVVYQKDLGPKTLDTFRAMERFNPDQTWAAVEDQ
jgi:DUF2950 family protein